MASSLTARMFEQMMKEDRGYDPIRDGLRMPRDYLTANTFQMATTTNVPDIKSTDAHLKDMLYSRMGWDISVPKCPLAKCFCSKLNDEAVAVFVIHNGKALVVEDDAGLFPSDTLVSQLRLLGDK
ncbi:hypothetical protein IVA80_10985 [Bradyrhizobium sp. 139]|uniref:hypothetical protein n=1 Tax=Bradyrhizobium sp. 139 TaxID=2782616 RepID=UPI001FF958A5|nr:hypothetical protein [Bradyrhizobium sp. 139]MCK1741375.1 hypothetical protein [Bradyrhizobium sp. 139]